MMIPSTTLKHIVNGACPMHIKSSPDGFDAQASVSIKPNIY